MLDVPWSMAPISEGFGPADARMEEEIFVWHGNLGAMVVVL